MTEASKRQFLQWAAALAGSAMAFPVVAGANGVGTLSDQVLSDQKSDDPSAYDLLARQARTLLISLRHAALAAFLADWPTTTDRRVVVPAATLPVLRYFADVQAHTSDSTATLVSALSQAVTKLEWRQTYSASEVGADFLANYGWSELIGLRGPVPSDRIACGLLLLGPGTLYPRHCHPAEEIYVPLSGTAAWQQAQSPWRELPPGSVIHHQSNVSHSMRTTAQPLLALYLWRGDLKQKARLSARAACGPSNLPT